MLQNSILDYISSFRKITIQCHNIPDADTLASAWGLSLYLQEQGNQVRIIYGGPAKVSKRNLKQLIKLCNIPLQYIGDGKDFAPDDDELLVVVDAQYTASNLVYIPAKHWAVIDHHPSILKEGENVLIRPDYQCCATIVWELLMEKGFPIDSNRILKIAFSYALYTDTSAFSDLHNDRDIQLMKYAGENYPELDVLKKSNLTMAELMIASDALYHNYADFPNHFMIISALRCDQTILGVIGDLAIQVDGIELTVSLTFGGSGYRFSIRSCGSRYHANEIARCISQGIGDGGGHERKAAGVLSATLLKQKYPNQKIEDIITERILSWVESQT